MEPLEKAARGVGGGVKLWLDRTEAVEHIRAVLDREGRGRGRVVLVARTEPGIEVEMPLAETFNISPKVMQAMKVLPGVSLVEEI